MAKTEKFDAKYFDYLCEILNLYGNISTNRNPSVYLPLLEKNGMDCYVWKVKNTGRGARGYHYLLERKYGYGC